MLKKSTSKDLVVSNAIPILKIFKSSIHRPLRLADIEKRTKLSHQTVFRKVKILKENSILIKEGNSYRPDFKNIIVHKIFNLISAAECESFYGTYPGLKEPFSQLKEFAIKNQQISYIILFGSYAINKATKTSDIDILIVADNIKAKKKKIDTLFSQIEGGYFLNKYSFSPIYATKKDIKKMIDERKKFMQAIIEEGIIIYGDENYFREMSENIKEWSLWK